MSEDANGTTPIPRTAKQRSYARFEVMGEEEVRRQLQVARLGGQRAAWAHEWLARFDEEREAAANSSREARMEASSAESLRIARSAKNTAWAAAVAAIIAIIISIGMPFFLKWSEQPNFAPPSPPPASQR